MRLVFFNLCPCTTNINDFFLVFLHLLEDKKGGSYFKCRGRYVLMVRGTFVIIILRIVYNFFRFPDKDKSHDECDLLAEHIHSSIATNFIDVRVYPAPV